MKTGKRAPGWVLKRACGKFQQIVLKIRSRGQQGVLVSWSRFPFPTPTALFHKQKMTLERQLSRWRLKAASPQP